MVDRDAYAEMVSAQITPETADDATLAPYANYYLEYNGSFQVTREVSRNAPHGATNGGNGQSFVRTANPAAPLPGYNRWQWKVIQQDSNGNQLVVYLNYIGQPMLKVLRQIRGGVTPREWCTFYKYDNVTSRRILVAKPSAVMGYDETKADLLNEDNGEYEYLRNDHGLIMRTTYYASTTATSSNPGGVAGYLHRKEIQQGQLGAWIKQEEMTYIASDNTAGAVFAPAASTEFRDETDQDDTAITTTYQYEWYTTPRTRMKEKVTVFPTVPIEQNGASPFGTTAEIKQFFDTFGNVIFSMNEVGIITKLDYNTTGQMVRRTEDVSGVTLPPGWSVTDGSHLNLETDYLYFRDADGQVTGRLGNNNMVVMRPDGTRGPPPLNDRIIGFNMNLLSVVLHEMSVHNVDRTALPAMAKPFTEDYKKAGWRDWLRYSI
ncbi:MAG: hypothetical protein AAF492_24020, partial [Verrucomicrobiota bacterium]